MSWFQRLFSRRRFRSELSEEIRAHLDEMTEELVASGLPPDEARAAARRQFGNLSLIEEDSRRVWRWPRIEDFLIDVRYGLRMLLKNPGFTVVAVLTLALGIGANTAIFSAIEAVLLRPLPFPASEQLVRVVSVRSRDNAPDNVSYPDFADWRTRSHSFSQMAAYHTDSFTLTGQGEALHIQGAVVSAELFSVLDVKPYLGRAFLPQEDQPGTVSGEFVVILSHALWREHFRADPNIIGRTVNLDDRSFTVVGVMPAGFQFPIQNEAIEFWTTVAVDFLALPGQPSMAAQRGAHYFDVIARLNPSVSAPQAQADLSTIVAGLNEQYPENAPRTVQVVPELDQLVGHVRPALLILLGAVGCVLLIACGNVGNLLLSRGASREKEMAVRRALGAGRWRLIRQLLTESVMLALAGGALGIALARWGVPPLIAAVPEDVPRTAGIHVDGRVLLFTGIVSLLTGIVFGLGPALQNSRFGFGESLKEGARSVTEGARRVRLRNALVVADVALAAVLLVGAGLLLKSLLRLEAVDLGYKPQGVLTFKIDLPFARYPVKDQAVFFERALARLNQLPGVRSVSAVLPLPLDGDEIDTLFAVDGQPTSHADEPRTNYSWVEPGYFQTVGIPLRQGRDFSVRDSLESTPVVIINETLARLYFPGRDPLGKRIQPGVGNGYPSPPMRQIVGVVRDIRQNGLTVQPGPQVYVPRAQSPLGSMIVVLNTKVAPSSVAEIARQEVASVDKDVPIYAVRTFDHYFSKSVGEPHFLSTLLAIFAALALVLATIGLYGVISYSTAQRTHEIGVRMALGARRHDVLVLVLRQGLRLALIGVAIGILGSLGVTRLLSSLLYGVHPSDLSTFALVSLGLMFVALLACYIPARRATRVDPMVALRYE